MPAEPSKYVIVMTTCPNDEEAHRLASELVGKRLAAYVQASNIISTYRWQGTVETAKEVRLLIKARQADYEAVAALILAMHSYDTPEVVAIPLTAGSTGYLDWIDSETRR
jgi:periplasmic divalent cation tolerance protein